MGGSSDSDFGLSTSHRHPHLFIYYIKWCFSLATIINIVLNVMFHAQLDSDFFLKTEAPNLYNIRILLGGGSNKVIVLVLSTT